MRRKDVRPGNMLSENLEETVDLFDSLLARYEDATYEACAMVLLAYQLRQTGDKLDRRLCQLAANVRSDHPLMGETFGIIGSGLSEIATAINDFTSAHEHGLRCKT